MMTRQVVRKHILEEVLCCSGIQKNNLFFNSSRRRSSAGQVSVGYNQAVCQVADTDGAQVRRTASGHLYADRAEISTCDLMAGNGVVLQVRGRQQE